MPKLMIPSIDLVLEISKGERLADVCDDHALPLALACRSGACGTCMFRVLSGAELLSEPTDSELEYFASYAATRDCRLACQCKILGDVAIEPAYE